jgi:tetratricopeptide (TPR) repeat protein
MKKDAASANRADPPLPTREKPNPAYLSHVQNRLQGPDPARLSDELARKAKDLAEPPDGNAESESSPESHRHQAAVAKSTRIAALIEETKAAISRKDTAAIKRLLTQLGQLKGPESPYVLNLTAYWHLTQKDYAAAGQLLNQVLNLNRTDLEAGYNMALVEIHSRQPKEAYQRLARLREIYPDNLAVAELMGKLK